MATKERQVDRGSARGKSLIARAGAELRNARVDRGLSLGEVGRSAGLSVAQVSRIERGEVPGVSVLTLAKLHAILGLDLSVGSFPAGQPIRDAAHVALLGRFRDRLQRSLDWRTEVPLPLPGDLRAWDGMIVGRGWRMGVEAETRPHDLQALGRRIALKQRDGGMANVILLLNDSRYCRAMVRANADSLALSFPLPGKAALELLTAGADPGASAVVLL